MSIVTGRLLEKPIFLYGAWQVLGSGDEVRFRNRSDPKAAANHGLALIGANLEDGIVECDVTLTDWGAQPGAFLIVRANGDSHFYAAGIGGWDNAFSILEGSDFRHFTPLEGVGKKIGIEKGRAYRLQVIVQGQTLKLFVENTKVAEYRGLEIPGGVNVGLLCLRQTEEAIFSSLRIDADRPRAFVVMQFSSPYNEIYRDAIQPLIAEVGFEPIRVDDIFEPNNIIEDIHGQISGASVVIADVSEPNPNVYYEVGLSHAMRKPTFLLAQKGARLPFDIGPNRCIFYENTIPGRARLQEQLRRGLETRLGVHATTF